MMQQNWEVSFKEDYDFSKEGTVSNYSGWDKGNNVTEKEGKSQRLLKIVEPPQITGLETL